MSSTVLKQIENLIAHMRHKDPNVRYKALKKLGGALGKEKYSGYHTLILEAVAKYAAKDKHRKIRGRAEEYLASFDNNREDEDVKGHLKRIVGLTVGGFIGLVVLIVVIGMLLPESEETTTTTPVITKKSNDKQVIQMEVKAKKGYVDHLKVEIKNTVKFKGKKLFTNIMTFKLQRKIVKLLKAGNFVVKQWVTEGFGVVGNLHEFGYPNLGETLYIKYNSLGKAVLIKNRKSEELPKLTTLKFTKYSFPKVKMLSGSSWKRGYKYSFQTRFKLDGYAYLKKKKLIRVLYDSVPSEGYAERMKGENYAEGVMYLDSKNKMLLHSVRTLTFKSKPGRFSESKGFNLSSKMLITETSSKLDKIKNEGILHEKIENVIDSISSPGAGTGKPRGVTD